MSKSPFLLILAFMFISCGKKFDSKQPWNDPTLVYVAKQDANESKKLLTLANSFAYGQAASNYYFEEVVLENQKSKVEISLHFDNSAQLFFEKKENTTFSDYTGKWKVPSDRKGTHIELEYNNGSKAKIFSDKNNGKEFLIGKSSYTRIERKTPELEAVSDRKCEREITKSSRDYNRLLCEGELEATNQGIDFNNCSDIYKKYMDELLEPSNTSAECSNIAKNYKDDIKSCKISLNKCK